MQRQIPLKLSNLSLKAVLFAFFLSSVVFALEYPSFNGYQIVDLTSKNIDTFYLETQKWNVTGLIGTANSSLCGTNNPLLGGYGILDPVAVFTRNYTSLPAHTAVYYQITFSFIDKFKNPDYFTLMLDSASIAGGGSLRTYNAYLTSNVCGGPDGDTTQFVIAGSMPHIANLLTFQLTSKAATGTNSGTLGIRDIQLTFVNDSSVTIPSSCFRVFDSQLLGLSGECSCTKGSYLNSGSCVACSSACQNCFGPSSKQCFACASGYSFNGTKCIKCDSSCLTCTGPGSLQCVTCKDELWLQPNGSCTAGCDLPVATRQAVGSLQLCYASCATNQYILYDGTCVDNCSLPLVISTSLTNQFCNQPCKTGEYLYWNGTCIAGCGGPLVSSSLNGVLTCNKPCQTGESLYWDNSCLIGCSTPLVSSTTSDGVLLCNKPCQTGQSLYWNNSCIAGCGGFLISSTSNAVLMCNKPCQSGEYLDWNFDCITACPTPLVSSSTSDGVLLCNKPCQTGESLYWNSSCIAGCGGFLISSTLNEVDICNKPCQTGQYLDGNNNCITGCPSPLVSTTTSDNVFLCNKPCQNSDYFYWNGSCIAGCYGLFKSSNSNGVDTCNQPCQTGESLYWNSSCIIGCSTPLFTSTNDSVLTCNQPCQTGESLYWNNSCLAGCDMPLVSLSTSDNVLTCSQPCKAGEYLNWDNLCIITCPTPLVSSLSWNSVALCNKPCQSNDDFFYTNGSCLATCPSPFISSNTSGVALCNEPCPNNEFLYWNGACSPTCSSPLVSSSTAQSDFCNKPCKDFEFLYEDNSCQSTCPTPYLVSTDGEVLLCNKPCKNNDFFYWNDSCNTSCPIPLISSAINGVSVCNKPCQDTEFFDWNNKCVGSCLSPLVISSSNAVTLCQKPCDNNDFLYWNNTCNSSCPTPLVSSMADNGVVALCNKPCQENEFLDWNNLCVDSCPIPLVSSSSNKVATCAKPCQDNEYLSWDGSCIATCQSPLVSSIMNGVNLCSKPCQNNDFLYSDGSCLSTCPSPFLQSSDLNVNLCQPPCANYQFLYPNGSCSNICPAPLVPSIPIDGIQRCNSPCLNPSDYYYNANYTCGRFCSSPNTVQTIEFLQVCLTPISTDQPGLTNSDVETVEQTKATANAAGAAASVGIAASSVIASHGSGAITLVSLIKMLDYIRYMKVNYPPKLEYMLSLKNYNTITLNLNVNLPENIENEFPNYPLPGKFGKYDLVSSFFVNYWQELFTLIILLLVLATCTLLANRAKDVKYIGTYSKRIQDILKWNLFLIIFCGNIDSVGVLTSLEFRTTHFNSFASVFGTLMCIFINLLVLYLMLMIPYIVYTLRRARRKVLPWGKKFGPADYNAKADAQRFALCGVLFLNFKEKSIFKHSCMFFILLRVYLFNIIIGYFFEYPLTQAVLITIMSALMLTYFCVMRPFKNPLELIKTLTYEIIIAMVNICVLILAAMDHGNIENNEDRVRLGDVIIVSNMLFNLMAVIFMVVELVIKIIKVYKLRKTIVAEGWKYWMNIAAFLLKPEELETDDEKENPIIRIQAKYASKIVERQPSAPKKRISVKGQSLSDDQSGHDSDTPPERASPIFRGISSPTSVYSLNKVGILKTNSIISLDAFSDFASSKNNLLTPANARSSLFTLSPPSPRSLLQSQESGLMTPSSRILTRFASRLSFIEKEQNKSMSEIGDILPQRNKSSEASVNPSKFIRRKERSSTGNYMAPDNNENLPDFSFESGVLGKSGANTPLNRPRFSRFSPEKSRAFPEVIIVKENNFFKSDDGNETGTPLFK